MAAIPQEQSERGEQEQIIRGRIAGGEHAGCGHGWHGFLLSSDPFILPDGRDRHEDDSSCPDFSGESGIRWRGYDAVDIDGALDASESDRRYAEPKRRTHVPFGIIDALPA